MTWPAYLHRRTFWAAVASDALLLPAAIYLASKDVKSWAIALPILALNLPAIPLAIMIAVLGGGLSEASYSPSVDVCVAFGCFAGIVSVAGWGWSFAVAGLLRE